MSKKLTEIQIIELFAFCRKHRVCHYDLQIELVDHLASIIESRWELESNLSFQMILNQIYNEFGKYGFHMIKLSKEKALNKKYRWLLWKYIGDFFKLPKIILTIFITIILFSIFSLSTSYKPIFFAFLGFYALTLLVYMDKLFLHKFRIDLSSEKTFLLSDYLKSFKDKVLIVGVLPIIISSFFNIVVFKFQLSITDIVFQFFAALLITFLSIIFFAICFYVPKRIKEDFVSEFPQFVKS